MHDLLLKYISKLKKGKKNMGKIEIEIEEFMKLHEKAVKYDLLKKEYDAREFHTTIEDMIFGEKKKEITLDFVGGEE
jgi:hypothetical protein